MAGWYTKALALATVAALMSACGGGNDNGSGPSPNSAAAPAPAPAPGTQVPVAPTNLSVAYDVRTYSLSWNAAAGATSYDVYEDPDGAGPQESVRIATGVTAAAYTFAIPVLLNERIAAQYTVRACNAAGCGTPSASLQPDVLKAAGTFKGSNGAAIGDSVALSRDGLTLAVGATADRSNATGINGNPADSSIQGAGAVYVFSKVNGRWVQQAYVKPPATASVDEHFGWSVALSGDGNTLAVGSEDDSSATGVNGDVNDSSKPLAGGVNIYTRSGGTWSHQAFLKAGNTDAGDDFGLALALSEDGNTLVAGARGDDSNARTVNGDGTDNSANGAGSAFVFVRNGATWSQQAYLKASNADPSDSFGESVAISGDGNLVVVGAPGERSNATGVDGDPTINSVDSGAAYVFQRSGTAWTQQHYLKASNSGSSRNFGLKVAVSSDASTIAVGGPNERSASRGINGSTSSSTTGTNSGAVWVFAATATSWRQQAYVKASNADANDFFGSSISLSTDGSVLAVGAFQEGSGAPGFNGTQNNDAGASGSGAAYLFRRSGTAWTQAAYLKSLQPTAGGNFGRALALARDGNSLAISGDGAVYLY